MPHSINHSEQRAAQLLSDRHQDIYCQTDRMFGFLMLLQWPAAIAAALWISPQTWIGTTKQVHIHVWAAVILGAIISSAPLYFAFLRPGQVIGRHVIAVGQMLMAALLIDVTGGRIETHFHIFGSLAFLAFYRDWRVLITGSIVVATDHFIRGTWWPGTVFGVFVSSPWRWVEHAAWVVFEDIVLLQSCRLGVREMRNLAWQQAQLETTNARVEATVAERTSELQEVNARLEEEVAERRRADEELRFSALHDVLTGLPNRKFLLDRLDQRIKQTKRQRDQHVALLFIDLDNFKLVNDSLGHEAGDELLIEAARRIVLSLRDTDTISRSEADLTARLGGDEFVVLLDNIQNPENAVRVSQRILEELGKPAQIRGHEIKISGSVGVAMSQPGQLAGDLIRDADTAMYRAKEAGKSGYAVFNMAMHAHVRERLQLENALRRAIDEKQFILHYQPIIDLTTSRAIAFEALVRWQHPEKGLVTPADFVPVAEETGLIVPLGEWIMEESLSQLNAWNRDRDADSKLSMNINVSKRQLLDPHFVPCLEAMLARYSVSPETVQLEITESVIVLSPERARHIMDKLVQLGVKLHLDDFGTGLSSLSCLKNFPLTGLKIDRSFIQGTDLEVSYAAILHAIVSLSHNLGLQVVAEGVEDQSQLATVLALECDYVQGFLFSEPLPAPAAARLLDQSFVLTSENKLVPI